MAGSYIKFWRNKLTGPRLLDLRPEHLLYPAKRGIQIRTFSLPPPPFLFSYEPRNYKPTIIYKKTKERFRNMTDVLFENIIVYFSDIYLQ